MGPEHPSHYRRLTEGIECRRGTILTQKRDSDLCGSRIHARNERTNGRHHHP